MHLTLNQKPLNQPPLPIQKINPHKLQKCETHSRYSKKYPSISFPWKDFQTPGLVSWLYPFLSPWCVSGNWPCCAAPWVDSHFLYFQTAPWGLLSPGCQSQTAARRSSPCCREPEQRGRVPGVMLTSALVHLHPTNTWGRPAHTSHLNVHGQRQGWLDRFGQREVSPLDGPVDDVIAVHCHDQVNGQPHLLSDAPSLWEENNGFLAMTPKSQTTKEKIDDLNIIKIKKVLCFLKLSCFKGHYQYIIINLSL